MLSQALQKKLRETLPYGVYIGEDGRETLYNRMYQPMLTRGSIHEDPVECNPHTWITHTKQAYFFNDWNSPFYADNKRHKESRKRCENVLIAFHNRESIEPFFESVRGEE